MTDVNAMLRLDAQVAIVTGAAKGLGQFYCRVLAEAGAQVVVSGRSMESLQQTIELVKSVGGEPFPVICNVRDVDSINAAVAQVYEKFGRIDVLVNNAGCNVRKRAMDITPEEWDAVLETNLRGQFFMATAVGKIMKAQHYGRIVNIGSATMVCAYKGITPYCSSRGGVKQMTASLACDFADYGIAVNALAPGWFATAQTAALWENEQWRSYIQGRIPQKRLGDYEELALPLLFLTSKYNSYYTGQVVIPDGGFVLGDTKATLQDI